MPAAAALPGELRGADAALGALIVRARTRSARCQRLVERRAASSLYGTASLERERLSVRKADRHAPASACRSRAGSRAAMSRCCSVCSSTRARSTSIEATTPACSDRSTCWCSALRGLHLRARRLHQRRIRDGQQIGVGRRLHDQLARGLVGVLRGSPKRRRIVDLMSAQLNSSATRTRGRPRTRRARSPAAVGGRESGESPRRRGDLLGRSGDPALTLGSSWLRLLSH